ncbi:MAG: long-chain-fatty-acid--CoA ligase [Alphaproteobacteria bacterium]|nr:long-chain-fatty-acid--CoA ligase [Alphaproteobacteria bacterium]
MRGLIMDRPLLISSLLRHAAAMHGDREFVARTIEGGLHRYTYAEAHVCARRLANALTALGVAPGDHIATIGWSTHRHYEASYAVAGMGAICHTVNPRLHPEQVAWIMNHAEDALLLADASFAELVVGLAPRVPSLRGIVFMTDAAHVPDTDLPAVHCYEDMVDGASDAFDWPEFDERTASSLCYTSGTTGNPKGVLYSHRSTVLHAYAACLPDMFGLGEAAVAMPAAGIFHVNGWAIPYAATLAGAKLVLPGQRLDGASVTDLMNAEGVTCAAGVPTVWQGLVAHRQEAGTCVPSLHHIVVGGAAASRTLIESLMRHGIEVRHDWGMTELSPIGTFATPRPATRTAGPDPVLDHACRQGRALFGVELRIVDDARRELPHDGASMGELEARGWWVAGGYFRLDHSAAHHDDGWFSTGDVCTMDAHGVIEVKDRSKDVIKSGGEWISSIDLENHAAAHPSVHMAAVIGMQHPKWDERPLLVVVARSGARVTKEEILAFLTPRVAKWWLPDDVVFVAELPLGATGKVLKAKLREDHAGRNPTI